MRSCNSNMRLAIEIAFNGVLSQGIVSFTHVLCIAAGTLYLSLAHEDTRNTFAKSNVIIIVYL